MDGTRVHYLHFLVIICSWVKATISVFLCGQTLTCVSSESGLAGASWWITQAAVKETESGSCLADCNVESQIQMIPKGYLFISWCILWWTVNKHFAFWIWYQLFVINKEDEIAESCYCNFFKAASVPSGDILTTTWKLYSKLIKK